MVTAVADGLPSEWTCIHIFADYYEYCVLLIITETITIGAVGHTEASKQASV